MPWTKVIIGGEYLVWEGKENFSGFRDFRTIDLALTSILTCCTHFST